MSRKSSIGTITQMRANRFNAIKLEQGLFRTWLARIAQVIGAAHILAPQNKQSNMRGFIHLKNLKDTTPLPKLFFPHHSW